MSDIFFDPNTYRNFINKAEGRKTQEPRLTSKKIKGRRMTPLSFSAWTALGQRIGRVWQGIKRLVFPGRYLDSRIKSLQSEDFSKLSLKEKAVTDWTYFEKDVGKAKQLSKNLLMRLDKRTNYTNLKRQLRAINEQATLTLNGLKELEDTLRKYEISKTDPSLESKIEALLGKMSDDERAEQALTSLLSYPLISATIDQVLSREGKGALRRQVLQVRYKIAQPLFGSFKSILSGTLKEPFEDAEQALQNEELKLTTEKYESLKKGLEEGTSGIKDKLKQLTGENIDLLVQNNIMSQKKGDRKYQLMKDLLDKEPMDISTTVNKFYNLAYLTSLVPVTWEASNLIAPRDTSQIAVRIGNTQTNIAIQKEVLRSFREVEILLAPQNLPIKLSEGKSYISFDEASIKSSIQRASDHLFMEILPQVKINNPHRLVETLVNICNNASIIPTGTVALFQAIQNSAPGYSPQRGFRPPLPHLPAFSFKIEDHKLIISNYDRYRLVPPEELQNDEKGIISENYKYTGVRVITEINLDALDSSTRGIESVQTQVLPITSSTEECLRNEKEYFQFDDSALERLHTLQTEVLDLFGVKQETEVNHLLYLVAKTEAYDDLNRLLHIDPSEQPQAALNLMRRLSSIP